jgi:hypothetical protein
MRENGTKYEKVLIEKRGKLARLECIHSLIDVVSAENVLIQNARASIVKHDG